MQGLLVLGAAHGADEVAVGRALAAELRRAGADVLAVGAVALGPGADEIDAAYRHQAAASPVTAARHEGVAIDPGELVQDMRDAAGESPLVVTAAGGLLAPLTPRYSVRDLARELGLPLVLAVPAGPDAVNVARLSGESARGAGLVVAAVVLTGWPDPPDRVLLDERRLLESLAAAPVLTFPRARGAQAEAARDWPAADWLATVAAAPAPPLAASAPVAEAPAPPPPTAAPVVLDPYEAWDERPLGDPRSTPRPRLMEALLEIAEREGPMLATRAYSLYNRAAGGKKLTTIARAPLSSSVYWLARDGAVVLTQKDEIPWQDDDMVRTPDAPPVRVRELGPRTLDEVPLDEIAELMRRLRAAHGVAEAAALKRAVLSTYGLVRLTARADEYLGLAVDLMDG